MKKIITFEGFSDEFNKSEFYKNCFTYAGKKAIFDYLEELEEDILLDIVSIACEYHEYNNLKEILENYTNIKDMEDLQDHTQVIEFDGGIIIQAF